METSSETIPKSPPGLEHLTGVNQLLVSQRFDLEVLDLLQINKTYEVMNNQGQRIYFAEERNNFFLQYLCGISRPFTLTVYDNVGQDIITMHKALRCSCCWSTCCLQKLSSLEEEIDIGNISKQCTRFVREQQRDANKFRIQFPVDLDVKSKALILGASFLIDYIYFEIGP
ncbi:phospholipid scramblase 2-like [Cavia porcellus]|uniref:phospholipid scramblase 2-like n=1 Tax=Cavia porcellus TaxID=10141 RepID=UPI002FE1829B